MRLLGDSIRLRLLVLSALLVGAALFAGYLVIASILEDFITARFDAETTAVAEQLIAAASLSDQGRLEVRQQPADPRFAMPLSGWYWQLSQENQIVAKSSSLFDGVLPQALGTVSGVMMHGPSGQLLRVNHVDFTLPGSEDHMSITVSAPATEIEASLGLVRRPLAVSLAALWVLLTLASVLQVTAGLRSLDHLGRNLRAIRDGKAEALPLPPVAELRPVAAEINALLDQNRTVLARNREHIGNLAHSLKTPLSALSNALPPDHAGQALIARMDRQIGWHLRRARSSAAPRLLGQRTEIAPVLDDILLVLHRPIEDADLTVVQSIPPGISFAGERQDLEEMIGNLTENAVKWAISTIHVTASTEGETGLRIMIEDDGPGMTDQEYAEALMRGRRLDESGPPGAGLGLAIVADLAALHGGRLALSRSDLGGLMAVLDLPA